MTTTSTTYRHPGSTTTPDTCATIDYLHPTGDAVADAAWRRIIRADIARQHGVTR